ncbi:MAG: hypothetical protein KDA20_00400 [Phycisphaerales bacterium]|nr:hypothetical protein [Phycisphaerales bacterium]
MRRASVMWMVCVCAVLGGCNRIMGQADWARETNFEFSELPRSRASQIQQVFLNHSLSSEIMEDASVTTFRVRGIVGTRQLAYVLHDIDQTLLAMAESSPLERATLRFGSLAAQGRIYSTIEVRVSQNARAFIADRSADSPWREVPVAEGRFKGPVNTSLMVAEQRGWVYYAAYREGGLTYGRVNVLTGQTESRVDLPPGFPAPVAR